MYKVAVFGADEEEFYIDKQLMHRELIFFVNHLLFKTTKTATTIVLYCAIFTLSLIRYGQKVDPAFTTVDTELIFVC